MLKKEATSDSNHTLHLKNKVIRDGKSDVQGSFLLALLDWQEAEGDATGRIWASGIAVCQLLVLNATYSLVIWHK